MGEVADMIIDGTLCQICGCLMEDLIQEDTDILKESPSYPRTCKDCGKEGRNKKKTINVNF